jgi:branched-chain amino acid transport system permease protein
VAQNWVPVTGGPLCVTRIQPIQLGALVVDDLTGQYYVILAIATVCVLAVWLLSRSRLGLAFTAVRDDPVLADARGLSPTHLRLTAFSISAVLSALVGLFVAHFQTVVCPDSMGFGYTVSLLIMVFIGGRASLRGVVSAAVIFTALPQVLRLADEWRLAIFGLILLVTVTTFPDGLEHAYRSLGRLITSGARKAEPATAEAPATGEREAAR